jgi:exodeoxyribonuclease VII small subunit
MSGTKNTKRSVADSQSNEPNPEFGFESGLDASDIKESVSFESALGELELLVDRIEQTPNSLDETIAAYERGMLLVNVCRQSLQEAENKLKMYEQQTNQFKAFELDSKLKSS